MDFIKEKKQYVLVRGGGDLASGVALRLHRCGFGVIVSELPAPLVVRRMASFAQAVFDGKYTLEGVSGELVKTVEEAKQAVDAGNVAVMVDPEAKVLENVSVSAVVDARMMKCAPCDGLTNQLFTIGLGPGFTAGVDCQAVVETNRGAFLGRVYWQGSAEPNTGVPENVRGYNVERVLYSPGAGNLHALAEIGELLDPGEEIAEVAGQMVKAKFKGVVRGLIHDGLKVEKGMKIGDLDPRCDARLCTLASDKALAIGGGVLEAILTYYARR